MSLSVQLLQRTVPVLLLVAVISVGWNVLKSQGADWVPVRYVRVEGAFQYIAKEKIKKVLNEHVMYGFFNIDLQQLRTAIKTLPWAEQVAVERVWPDAIKVMISEQQPIARWRKEQLMNLKGELFKPDNIAAFDQLPLIHAPLTQPLKALEIWKGIRLALQDHGMQIKSFYVSDRRAWKLDLDNGLQIIMGRSQQLPHMQRFLNTLDVFDDDMISKMASVDLRYPNGYAVSWKEGSEMIDWQTIMQRRKQYEQTWGQLQEAIPANTINQIGT